MVYELYGITDEERKIIETYRNFRPLKLRLFQFFAYGEGTRPVYSSQRNE